jgi:hypothetical protein
MSMIYQLTILPDELAGRTLANPESIHELLESLQGSPDVLGLEKSWHGLHFLLTGDAWMGDPPLNFLTMGGEEVGDIDVRLRTRTHSAGAGRGYHSRSTRQFSRQQRGRSTRSRRIPRRTNISNDLE